MRQIYMHIGMHKTGSTSIQINLNGYDDGQTKYADLGYENHSIPFYTVYSGRHHNYNVWERAGLSADQVENKKHECLARIKKSLGQDSHKNLIFSGEDILNIPETGLSELKLLLEQYSKDIKLFAYIREPISYMQSNLQELIHAGQNVPAPPPAEYYRFKSIIKVFGRENITFRLFDKKHLLNGDVVDDFCNLIDIKKNKHSRLNASLSTEVIKCLYKINNLVDPALDTKAFLPLKQSSRNHFLRLLRANFPGKFGVPDNYILPYLDIDDWEWMQKTMGETVGPDYRNISVAQSSEKLSDFFETFTEDMLDRLEEILVQREINTDFKRNPTNMIHRLYIECVYENVQMQINNKNQGVRSTGLLNLVRNKLKL